MKLVLATRNRKKGLEMVALIAPPWEAGGGGLGHLEVETLAGYPDVPEVVEDAETFAGNARKKASEVARALGVWVVADDSGLAVDALGGEPGVYWRGMRGFMGTTGRIIGSCWRRWGGLRTRTEGRRLCARWRVRIRRGRLCARLKGRAGGGSFVRSAGGRGLGMIHCS